MLSKTLPVSAKDLVRYTPDRYGSAEVAAAVEKAGEAAKAALDVATTDAAKERAARALKLAEADLNRFTKPPCYLLAVPTMQGRAAYNRDLAGAGADFPGDDEFLKTIAETARSLMDPAEAEPVLDAIERVRSDRGDEPAKAMVERAQTILIPHDPHLQALRARRAYWFEMAPLLAARRWLMGAVIGDGDNLMVRRGLDGLATEDALREHFPDADITACGWHALGLTNMDRPTAKN